MKIFLCVLLIASMLGMGGCNNAEQPVPVQSETPSAPVQSETPLSSTQFEYVETTLGNFHIALATDEVLNKYDSFHEYINNEDGASLIIRTDTVIKNFAFITVDHDDTGDKISLLAGDALFSVNELSPEKPFVVKLMIPGLVPAYGISFVDENDVERFYTINLSNRGVDEAPPYYLLEFENGNSK